MIPAVDPDTMSTAKRARFRQFCALIEEGEKNVPAIAFRMKVSERTIERYLHYLHGPRKKDLYPELMPRIMEHLRRYPDSEFTSLELARVLDVTFPSSDTYDGDKVLRTLEKMEAQGLIVCARRPYNSLGHRLGSLVKWYRLAPEHRP